MGESPSPSYPPVEFWNEFRAVYTRPTNAFDTVEDRERGYVTEYTKGFTSPVEARLSITTNSKETLRVYAGMQMSWVSRTKWEEIAP